MDTLNSNRHFQDWFFAQGNENVRWTKTLYVLYLEVPLSPEVGPDNASIIKYTTQINSLAISDW